MALPPKKFERFKAPGEKQDRRNGEIRAPELRVVDTDGGQLGIMSKYDALKRAEEMGLDLVEISPNAVPPVAKIMDYGKFLYQKQKEAHNAKKNQHVVEIKEMKFRPVTDENDYQIKLRNLTRFIEEGDKIKINLRFRGREMSHQDVGMEMMKRLQADLGEIAAVEQFPKLDGKQMVMVMAPKKK